MISGILWCLSRCKTRSVEDNVLGYRAQISTDVFGRV
jgi:hypothetical protein